MEWEYLPKEDILDLLDQLADALINPHVSSGETPKIIQFQRSVNTMRERVEESFPVGDCKNKHNNFENCEYKYAHPHPNCIAGCDGYKKRSD